MSSDQRWQGGIANRTWQAGTKPEPTIDPDHINQQVRAYLDDCARNQLTSTETGCLKVVGHTTDDQKKAVIQAYRDQKSKQYAAAEQAGAAAAYEALDLFDPSPTGQRNQS